MSPDYIPVIEAAIVATSATATLALIGVYLQVRGSVRAARERR